MYRHATLMRIRDLLKGKARSLGVSLVRILELATILASIVLSRDVLILKLVVRGAVLELNDAGRHVILAAAREAGVEHLSSNLGEVLHFSEASGDKVNHRLENAS